MLQQQMATATETEKTAGLKLGIEFSVFVSVPFFFGGSLFLFVSILLSVGASVCLSVSQSVCLSVCLCSALSVCLSIVYICLPVLLSLSLILPLSVYLSPSLTGLFVCVCVCVCKLVITINV